MQIIQCDKCEKRYKVRETISGAETLKYKCNACFNIIVVSGNIDAQDADQLQAAEKELLVTKTADSGFHAPEHEGPVENGTFNLNIQPKDTTSHTTSQSMGLKTKFNIAICAIFLGALVLIYFLSGSRLQKDAEVQIFDKAHLLLTTMESSRSFTSKVIKPALYQALPGRFIVEGMSSSFGARNIFERIRKTYPQYYFKHAAPHPRNPINQADAFEMGIIEKFTKNPELKEWQGYRTSGDEKIYSIMKPIVAEQRCMRCHSDPALAPQELLDRYGDKRGFGRSVGEIIGTLTVSVPASVVIDKARNNTMHFIGMVVLFFVLLALIVNVFFTKMVLKPIKHLADNADEISLGRLETHINTSGGDEIAKLAKAFDRMKISIKMAFDQLAR
jgi:HAMP domain-containing protein